MVKVGLTVAWNTGRLVQLLELLTKRSTNSFHFIHT